MNGVVLEDSKVKRDRYGYVGFGKVEDRGVEGKVVWVKLGLVF